MKAKKAAAEQAEANKLKTKKEKAKAPADKATKKVVEQAMSVDASPTKATKERAAVHICGPASPSYPLWPLARAVRRTPAMGCASPSSGATPSRWETTYTLTL